MKYALYEAVDNRDGKPMLWLERQNSPGSERDVALFHPKTAPSRIKQRTAAAPEGIVWDESGMWGAHLNTETVKIIDEWEFQS
ncbi:hypothetical protein CVB26_21090 [Salmonella enterica subsp. enterica serovar Cerro]|nr:hypothetical protein [Salmonella enterica subsp. enterica serovar Cerro]